MLNEEIFLFLYIVVNKLLAFVLEKELQKKCKIELDETGEGAYILRHPDTGSLEEPSAGGKPRRAAERKGARQAEVKRRKREAVLKTLQAALGRGQRR